MRRASAALLLLASCGTDTDARARCDRAIERSREMLPSEVRTYVAHECADLYSGRCREVLRHIEDYPVVDGLRELQTACADQGKHFPFAFADPGLRLEPKNRVPVDPPARAPRVVVYADHVDVERSPQNVRIDYTCDALVAALDGISGPDMELAGQHDVQYNRLVEVMDCLVQHGFSDIGLVPPR